MWSPPPSSRAWNKTDEGFWSWAIERAGVSPERAVHVGNRLDSDIRPMKRIGIRAVCLLRGETPPAPTVEQLTEPDAVITSVSGLPSASAAVATARIPVGTRSERR